MLIVVARIQNCCPCMPYPFTWFLTNRNESFTKPYLPTCYYNSSQMWIVRRGVLPLRTHGFLFIWAPGSPLPGAPFFGGARSCVSISLMSIVLNCAQLNVRLNNKTG